MDEKPKSKRGGARKGAGRKPKAKASTAAKSLNPKRERFVHEYVAEPNATQAAINAGYSEASAYSQGHDLLKNPEVATAIHQKREAILSKLDITAERVLEELALLAFYDPADVAMATDEKGEPIEIRAPRDIARLPLHIRKAIVGWSWDRNNNFTLKFAPKPATLNLLGQHFKLFNSDGDDALKEGLAALLQEARQRAQSTAARMH